MSLDILKKSIFPLLILVLAYLLFINSDAKTIIAGIAIFLIGMIFMEDGFKLFSGGLLEKILEKFTSNLTKSIATGFVVTSIVQSSSLLTIIIISFLSAELISLSGAIGVIFGANIGTTTTAWIVSAFGVKIKIAQYAMPMLIFGVMFRFKDNKSYKGLGNILVGLGFVFLGIDYMKDGFESLKAGLDLAQFAIDGYLGVFIYIGIGIVATVIIQSSSATMALVITALATGQIEYTNALALAIGANIGTTITAILGSLLSNFNGKRLAIAHLIFNLVTGLIAIVFLYQLSELVDILAAFLTISSTDYAMKLALFHTVFNVIGVLVVSPFTPKLVTFLNGVFQEKRKSISRAKYLDKVVIEIPEIALLALKKEIIHLYDNSSEAISHALSLHRHTFIGMGKDISTIVNSSVTQVEINLDDVYERKIKSLYGDIIYYAATSQDNMTVEDKHKVYSLKIASKEIVEAIKDVKELQNNINKYMKSKNEYMKDEYNILRSYIANTLDVIHTVKHNSDDFDVLAKLKILEEELTVLDEDRTERIDSLIRTSKIGTAMATSLINDSVFANNISQKLIDVAKRIWIENREIQELGEQR